MIALLPLMWPVGTERLGGYLYVADVVAVAALLAWVVALLLGQVELRRGGFYGPAALYLGAVIVSVADSVDLRRSLAALPIEIYVLVLALSSYNMVRSTDDLRRVFRAWMIGAAITAVAGVMGGILFFAGVRGEWNPALGGYGSLPAGNYPRVVGLFLDFNMACNYLSVSMLMLLAMRRLNWIASRPFRVLAPLMGIMAIFTVSPGLGGILLGAGIWAWVRWRPSRPGLARLALACGCAAALAFFLATMVSPVNSGGQGTVLPLIQHRVEASSRLLCWEAAWRVTLAHPIAGHGIGVPIECPAWTMPSGAIQHLTDAHNLYLSIAAHDGALGVLALAVLAIYLLRRSAPLTFDGGAHNVMRTALAIAFIQAFLYQGLSGSFEHTRHLWILGGLLAAVAEIRGEATQAAAESLTSVSPSAMS